MEERIHVAVIGAGGAGLCMARYLADQPAIFSTVIYEQTNNVGGTWVYTDKTDFDEHGLPIHSSIYKNLRTITPKQVMEFPDFPFPDDHKSYMTHSEVKKYLNDYTEHFSLRKLIQFNHQVVNVKPKVEDTKQTWVVTVKNLETHDSRTSMFDAVVVCNGHFSKPKTPYIPGIDNFPGKVLHSHQYRTPECYAGRKVVLIGGRLSGIDISLDLCKHAEIVYLSHHGKRIACKLPENLQQHCDVVTVEDDGTVVFEDGQRREVDVIMFCTGYLFTFPFLSKECGISVDDGRVVHLYKHLFNIEYPTMSFIGVPRDISPFPLFSLQARLVVAVLTKKTILPSKKEMLKDEEDDYQGKMSDGLKPHYAHLLGPRQWKYNNDMSDLAKCPPLNPIIKHMTEHCAYYRDNDVMNYKKMEYKSNSDCTFEFSEFRTIF